MLMSHSLIGIILVRCVKGKNGGSLSSGEEREILNIDVKLNAKSTLGVTKFSDVWIMCYSQESKMTAIYVKMSTCRL